FAFPPGHSSLGSFLTSCNPTDFFTLSLHDALPISDFQYRKPASYRLSFLFPIIRRCSQICTEFSQGSRPDCFIVLIDNNDLRKIDRKSTRLNSSHVKISYAVFCLKKKTFTSSHTAV